MLLALTAPGDGTCMSSRSYHNKVIPMDKDADLFLRMMVYAATPNSLCKPMTSEYLSNKELKALIGIAGTIELHVQQPTFIRSCPRLRWKTHKDTASHRDMWMSPADVQEADDEGV